VRIRQDSPGLFDFVNRRSRFKPGQRLDIPRRLGASTTATSGPPPRRARHCRDPQSCPARDDLRRHVRNQEMLTPSRRARSTRQPRRVCADPRWREHRSSRRGWQGIPLRGADGIVANDRRPASPASAPGPSITTRTAQSRRERCSTSFARGTTSEPCWLRDDGSFRRRSSRPSCQNGGSRFNV
jgi:hypothetical protein